MTKSRIIEISQLQEPKHAISVQATYIQASHDNLVSQRVIKDFDRLFKNLSVVELEGTHFLMQTNPDGVWKVIEEISL